VNIYRISMSSAFYHQMIRSMKPQVERPQFVYGILYEVMADQQDDFLLWDFAGGLIMPEMPGEFVM
jgi:hypothetical protein